MLDVLGVGVGPFNLSLVALLSTKGKLEAQFLEQRPDFQWHSGMLLPQTTLQVPFLADLVTLVDPTSPYSFLNYLHHHQRLLHFYFLEDFKILRAEYNHYCQWVARQLPSVQFDSKVAEIRSTPQGFEIIAEQSGKQRRYISKNIVIGTGSQPTLPSCLQTVAAQYPNRCMHSADFAQQFDYQALADIRSTGRIPRVLVLGAGQSAAEVFRELFDRQLDDDGQINFQLDWRTRSAGFFPMEYSPLGLEHFSPAYLDYFYDLDESAKRQLLKKQDLLYKGMGFTTIQDIYHRLYARTVAGASAHTTLKANFEMTAVRVTEGFEVVWSQTQTGQQGVATYDAIVAASGYRHQLPDCMDGLKADIQTDSLGQPMIRRHYQLEYHWPYGKASDQDANQSTSCSTDEAEWSSKPSVKAGRIFVQNQELHSHGVGAPDLGLGAYRAGCIVNQLIGETIYDIEALQVFQQFDSLG